MSEQQPSDELPQEVWRGTDTGWYQPADDVQPATARDPAPYEFHSPVWKGGHTQETDAWCYAATEQTIQEAFGGPSLEQAEIAHQALLQRGEVDPSVSAHRYYNFVKGLVDAKTISDNSWSSVKPELDDAMTDLHENTYGDLLLMGRTLDYTSKPQAEILLDTLLRDGLVAFGDAMHWRMIHGYYVEDANDLSQGVSFLVFDPETGADEWAGYDDIVGDMHDTRLVRS